MTCVAHCLEAVHGWWAVLRLLPGPQGIFDCRSRGVRRVAYPLKALVVRLESTLDLRACGLYTRPLGSRQLAHSATSSRSGAASLLSALKCFKNFEQDLEQLAY